MAASIYSIAQHLALMISNEADFLFGVQDQAQLLSNEIRLMSSALRDASEKRRTRNEVEEWLNQVRDVVMEAEDVIDFFFFRAGRQRYRNILTRYICYPNLLYNLHKFGREIENSNKKINQLSVRRSMLGLATTEAGQSSVDMNRNKQDPPFLRVDRVEEFCVIGLEEEEKKIVNKLLVQWMEPQRPCSTVVVSIVGMGGSGKTTLARKVYKRIDVKEHFQTRAWISVSQQYRIKDLLLVIIEQIKPLTSKEKKELNVESLIHRLKSHLRETTYLIVFDDLWRPEDWDMLKQALPVQGEGFQSRVLVTTRNETVARCADPSTDPYFQRLLNEDESWSLFLTKVMGSKYYSGCLEDLEDLGQKIVHKCHGLPLAIVVLGGLLSIKPKTHIVWSKILDGVNWELNQNERSCQRVLALSYTDLPDHLKPCFLYVGVFPEDSEIPRYKLIWLWVAEGFIQPRGRLTMEDVAEDYLEELIQRSMIQATGRSYDGRVTTCRIHDLVRDLAISEAKQERFLEVVGSYSENLMISPNKPRRLSIIEFPGGMHMHDSPTNALNQGTTAPPPNHLRSLLCLSGNIERNMWVKKSLYGAMKLLRVLDLEGAPLGSIPSRLLKQIGKLILLKYLSLRGSFLEKLPSSIGDLQNLQTLDLGSTHFTQLPMTMMKLQQLRNLVFATTLGVGLQDFDCPLDHMTNLQTLMLHEGKWMRRLDKLTNLRALLIISEGSRSYSYKEALLNAIPKLNHLRGLCLTCFECKEALVLPVSFSHHLELYHMYLEGIIGIRDFPSNLTTLTLSFQGGQLVDELMANLKKLPKLRCLVLSMADLGSKIIFSADGFRQLEELILHKLYDLQELTMEEGALPNLRVLRILHCSALKRLPCGLKQMFTLQELTLTEELEYRVRKDTGDDWEIIKHIPSIETKSNSVFLRNFYYQWC
ncbi:putative disease resistance RPP13-like protein 3 [Telopea speciosissima]|uniref:putative disease resistance RPP13-like protein 3 n=1 Tax=Telopea speciosissima TaxID=54955 RepID=UPI001CC6CED3|nr:putative disease resistance RPP13-like protein 3 [Telopea speciosissima]